jgi:hypothetical protein
VAIAPLGSTEGTGSPPKPVPSACPRGRYRWSFTASQGEPKPLIKDFVLPSQVVPKIRPIHVPPAGLAPGWLPRPGRIVVGHQRSGYPVASAPEA